MRTTLRLKVWDDWFELWAGEEILLDGDIIEGHLVMPQERLAMALRRLNYGVIVEVVEGGEDTEPD